jgi:primosomal replication protein N
MNELRLQATVVEMGVLRYTPANVPAIDLELEHGSEQSDAGAMRQVKLTLKAVAFGTMAERLARQPMNQTLRFSGFLALGARSKTPKLHIQDFTTVEAAPNDAQPNPDLPKAKSSS